MTSKVRIIEDHFGHEEGDVLEFIELGYRDRFEGLIGDHIIVKNKDGVRSVVLNGKFEWFHEVGEGEEIKEDDVIQLRYKVEGCDNPFYRAYRVEDGKVTFFDENNVKNTLNLELVEKAKIDSLFDAISSLAVRVREQDRFLEQVFNMSKMENLLK